MSVRLPESHALSYTDCPLVCLCCAAKKPEMDLFDTMDATDLNKRLKDLMDGLSVKVRTSSLSVLHARLCTQIFYPIAHAVSCPTNAMRLKGSFSS